MESDEVMLLAQLIDSMDNLSEDMEKALTSDAYGEDPQDAKDTIARGTEIGKDSESKPKETTPIENRPGETFGKNYKSVGDMMDSISQKRFFRGA